MSATGGRTWAQRHSGTAQYLFGVDFTDATHGWASGAAGTLLRSRDAGKTWKKVAAAPSGDLFALDFSDASHGWVAAGDERYPNAQLQYTRDAGAHWASQFTAPEALLYSVDAVNDTRGLGRRRRPGGRRRGRWCTAASAAPGPRSGPVRRGWRT